MEDEITINDIKYFSEDKYMRDLEEVKAKLKQLNERLEEKKPSAIKTSSKRFSEAHTLKLIKKLSAMLSVETQSVNEDYAVEKGITVIDAANVMLVIGKSEEAKRLLAMFKSFETEDKPEPALDYRINDFGIAKSKFSQEYLVKIIDVLKITDEGITITNGIDYPITLENKDFKFILAPRIDNGE